MMSIQPPPPVKAIELDAYRATTDRLRALTDFLVRSTVLQGGADDGDEDALAADNLSRIAALREIRRIAEKS